MLNQLPRAAAAAGALACVVAGLTALSLGPAGASTAWLRPGRSASSRNSDRSQDWTIWPAGTVDQLAAFGIVSRSVALHYGADEAFEAQYAPYRAGSGLCAGLAGDATNGESVTLQWCGENGRTIWVIDAADQACPAGHWSTGRPG